MLSLHSSLLCTATLLAFTLSGCAPTPPPAQPYTPTYPPAVTPDPGVSTPVPVPMPLPTAPTPPTPVAKNQYVIQFIASSSNSKAEMIKDQLANQGYNAFVDSGVVNGKLFHRVQLGGYGDKTLATNSLEQMRQQLPGNPHVANAIVKKA